jgi:hypothetical protein
VASFQDIFGQDLDSDDEQEAALAAAAAAIPPDLTGTQFVFSPAQVARERKRALPGLASDGKSMSTCGKTTDSTRLRLKEAQEQIAELKLALGSRPIAYTVTRIDKKATIDAYESPVTPWQALDCADNPNNNPETMAMDMDMEAPPSKTQLLGAANPKGQTIRHNDDAMEEAQHDIHVDTYPPLPESSLSESSKLSSDSSSPSLSSSSDGMHNTQDLVDQLSQTPYNSIKKLQPPKNLRMIDLAAANWTPLVISPLVARIRDCQRVTPLRIFMAKLAPPLTVLASVIDPERQSIQRHGVLRGRNGNRDRATPVSTSSQP